MLESYYQEICLITALCVIAIIGCVCYSRKFLSARTWAVLGIATALVVSGYAYGLPVALGFLSAGIFVYVLLYLSRTGILFSGYYGVAALGCLAVALIYLNLVI